MQFYQDLKSSFNKTEDLASRIKKLGAGLQGELDHRLIGMLEPDKNTYMALDNAVVFGLDNIKDYLLGFKSYNEALTHADTYINVAPPHNTMYFDLGDIFKLYLGLHPDEDAESLEAVKGRIIIDAGVLMEYTPIIDYVTERNIMNLVEKYSLKWMCNVTMFYRPTQIEKFGRMESPIFPISTYMIVDEHGSIPLNLVTDMVEFERKREEITLVSKYMTDRLPNANRFPLFTNDFNTYNMEYIRETIGNWNLITKKVMDDPAFRLAYAVVNMAITFTHCKNIQVKEVSNADGMRNSVLKKRIKHNNFVPLKYHIITIIPTKSSVKVTEGSNRTDGESMQAQHICRGHFKDFSKGNGLFGKYKGLYWWDSMVRGDKSNGIIETDYDVHSV